MRLFPTESPGHTMDKCVSLLSWSLVCVELSVHFWKMTAPHHLAPSFAVGQNLAVWRSKTQPRKQLQESFSVSQEERPLQRLVPPSRDLLNKRAALLGHGWLVLVSRHADVRRFQSPRDNILLGSRLNI